MSTGKRIQQVTDAYNEGLQTGVTTQGAEGMTYQFPRSFDAGTKQWDRMTRLKQSMKIDPTDPNSIRTPFGDLQFSDADARALMAKEDVAREAEFDTWFNQNYNKADLATRRLAQQLYPEFFAKREAEMIARAKRALQIALIDMRGPKSEEDLMIQFGLDNGDIVLEKGWNEIGFRRQFGNGDRWAFNMRQGELGETSHSRDWLAPQNQAPISGFDAAAAPYAPRNADAARFHTLTGRGDTSYVDYMRGILQ